MKYALILMLAVMLMSVNAMALQPSPLPDQIHLTWTGDPATTVTIQWRTDLSVPDGFVNYGPAKTYGLSVTGVSFTLSGKTATNSTYTQVVMLHRVTLQGLSPSTTYHYQAGSSGQLSADYYFTTAPKTGTTGTSYDFITCGDSRGTSLGSSPDAGINPSLSTFAATLMQKHPAFVLFSGDAASTGMIDEWDDWFAAMSAISPYVVIMPVDGNHEYYSPDFYSQFALPLANGRTDQNLSVEKGVYYSFDFANAHFDMLDDQSLFGVPVQTDELTWLKSDLQSTHAVWKFVSNHEPEFSSGGHGGNSQLQQYWVPVFMDNHVDMVFNGHNHFYERTYPLDQAGTPVTPASKGTIYIVAGSIGAPLYSVTQAPFIAYEENTYNYAVVHVAGNTISMDAYRLSDTPSINYDTLMDSIPAYTKPLPSGTGSAGCSCNTAGTAGSPLDVWSLLVILIAVLIGLRKLLKYSH